MIGSLVRLATQHPRRVVLVAVVLTLIAGVLGSSAADRLAPYAAEDPQTESVRADALLARSGVDGGVDVVALVKTPSGAASRSGRARVGQVAGLLRAEPDIGRVVTFDQGGRGFVARDGRSTYIAAAFRRGVDEHAAGRRLIDRLGDQPGVTLGGSGIASPQVNEQTAKDLKRAELLVFPLLFALSFVFFRSAVAALLPLLVGAIAIVLTLLGLRVAAEFASISVFALNVVIGLGLGLAIDYSLLIVSRYREELARVGPGAAALQRTLASAGRTVLFSSLTVAAALGSLLLFPQRFLYSMGIGGMIVALLAAAIALLVLPAVLALLGPRVNALAPARLQRAANADARPARSGGWYRLSRAVTRRPRLIATATATLLIALGTPFLDIKLTAVDASVLPPSSSARQVDSALKRDFDVRRTSPITLVAQTRPGRQLERYLADVRALPGVADVSRPRPQDAGLTLVDVIARDDALSDSAQQTVRDVRALDAPFTVLSRGQTATLVDLKASLAHHLPGALALLAATTFIVLFVMTGSVVLPIKALIMNLLTLSAAFGILVLTFQHGRLEGLLDYTSQGALEATQPIFLFAVAFGLSTDYAVFLLARIKEARDAGAPNNEAVALGLERTGRIVTAAALLFCVAVGAFATSEIIFLKQLGIGTALAVLIDATIVRALLVPALMALLGDRNWWAPRPLARLHNRLRLRDEASPA
ncbi:MAG TPA: MMPL family transporter [Solirubrobacteraceae bacterium]|nr:MMPL family transporter [Solirubrobacteraceae bacterium]